MGIRAGHRAQPLTPPFLTSTREATGLVTNKLGQRPPAGPPAAVCKLPDRVAPALPTLMAAYVTHMAGDGATRGLWTAFISSFCLAPPAGQPLQGPLALISESGFLLWGARTPASRGEVT